MSTIPRSLGDGLAVGVPLVALYAATWQRDLGVIDSGELAAVAAHLGIAHPTGYPLYTLLGRLTVMLAPSGAELTFLAALSALAVGLACVLTCGLLRELALEVPAAPIHERRGGTARSARNPAMDGRILTWGARVGALVLGTSTVVWSQAVTNEVYGLHLLFIVLSVRLGLRLLSSGPARERDLVLGAFLVGLSAGNHLSIVFLAPAGLFALVLWFRRAPAPYRRRAAAAGGLGFSSGLSVLLYLPLRSAAEPLLDWGDPETLPRLLRHLYAAQYRVWHFQSSERFLENATSYLARAPEGIGWLVLGLAPVGAVALLRRRRDLGAFLGLVGLVAFVWASGYEIFDLEPYYLPVDLVLVVLAGFGAFVLAVTRPLPRRVLGGAIACGLAVGLLQAGLRWRGIDRSEDQVVRFHLETVLAGVPEDAVLLSGFWDAVVSPLLYVQAVEGRRRDVTVVDPELLRRSWYYSQLDRWDPVLLDPVRAEVDSFLQALAPFESGGPFDAVRLETLYRGMIRDLAHLHRGERSTAFTADVGATIAGGVPPVPEGLVYVLRDDPAASPQVLPPDVDGLVRAGLRPRDRIHGMIVEVWRLMIRNRIVYLERFGRGQEARAWEEALARLEERVGPSPLR